MFEEFLEQFLKLYANNQELQIVAQLMGKYNYDINKALKIISLREKHLIGVFNDFEDLGKWMVKDMVKDLVIESPYLNVDMLLEHINYDKLGRRNAYHPNLILVEFKGKLILYRED